MGSYFDLNGGSPAPKDAILIMGVSNILSVVGIYMFYYGNDDNKVRQLTECTGPLRLLVDDIFGPEIVLEEDEAEEPFEEEVEDEEDGGGGGGGEDSDDAVALET